VIGVPTISTERLVLSPLADADLDPLHRAMEDREVMCCFRQLELFTPEQVGRMVARQADHWREHRCGWWAVTRRAAGDLIGWCGLQYLPETEEIEVGYLLGAAF